MVCIQQSLLDLLERTTSDLITQAGSALDDVIDRCLAELGGLFGADRVYLFQTAHDLDRFSNTHEWCAAGVTAQRDMLQDLPADFLPWWAAQMRAGRPIALASLDDLPAGAEQERALLDEQQIQSLLALPMRWQGRFWGFVGLDHVRRHRHWTADEVAVLGLVATAFAQGLQRRRMDARLNLASTVLHHAQEGIFVTDEQLRLLDLNPMFGSITGLDVGAVLGQPLRTVFAALGDEQVLSTVAQAGVWRGEFDHHRPDGERRSLRVTLSAVQGERHDDGGLVGVFSDISHLRAQEIRLQQLAYHDPLTQLPNRSLLADRAQQALARARRSGQSLAVCLLDLDRFKPINDEHGHADGDRVLIEVARRLQAVVRDNDSVARLGGDEFVLLLPELKDADEHEGILQRVQAALAEPIALGDGAVVQLSASIGVRTTPPLPDDADTLLRQADQALYTAKREGRARVHVFNAEDERQAQQRSLRIGEIASAITAGEMCLHYQPIVELKSGRALHAEALVRWRQPDGSLIAPGEWLPLIEATAVIAQLGSWVLRQALAACASWQAALPGLGVSVNVSARELCSPGFAQGLADALARHPTLPPTLLLLEVTESAPISALPAALRTMQDCGALGARFALDDFGTGYSSLAYLKSLPAAVVKLDRSFIVNLADNADDRRIVQGILQLVSGSGLQTIAEGVESDQQARELLALGCQMGQGYGIQRPVSEEELLSKLTAGLNRTA